MLLDGSLSAQDEGTYIDNASSQDSSSTEGVDLNLDEPAKVIQRGIWLFTSGLASLWLLQLLFSQKRKNKADFCR